MAIASSKKERREKSDNEDNMSQKGITFFCHTFQNGKRE